MPSFFINILCVSSAHLHSPLQPLGTRQHVPLSSDLTEGKLSPSPLPLTAVLGPGWSLSNIHTPLQCPEGWAGLRQGLHCLHLWTQDYRTVPLSPSPVPSWGGSHGWNKSEPQDSGQHLAAPPGPLLEPGQGFRDREGGSQACRRLCGGRSQRGPLGSETALGDPSSIRGLGDARTQLLLCQQRAQNGG